MVRTVFARRSVREKAAMILVCLLLLGSASCGLPRRARSMFGGQLPLQVSISPEANHNSPIAVELVIAYQGKLLDELLKMPAGDWFRKREQFLRDHPQGVETWKWEWVPGQEVSGMEIAYRVGAKGGVLFADYSTPGEHRAQIDPHQPARLVFNPTDFTVNPQP